MNKRKLPWKIASDIYSIPLSFFKEEGIENILLDLDNTLASYKDKKPSKRTIDLIDSYLKAGFKVAIASNNTNERVKEFAKELGIPAYCGLAKPFSGPLKKMIAKEGFDKEKTVLIGDQIMTDAKAANKAGIKSILTMPIAPIDPIWTRINRFLSKSIIKKLKTSEYEYLWIKENK